MWRSCLKCEWSILRWTYIRPNLYDVDFGIISTYVASRSFLIEDASRYVPQPFVSLLDRKLHTSSTIFQRCPFLFTVGECPISLISTTNWTSGTVCAVSSRYYNVKSEIYPVAMHFAKHSAANALTDGWKSIELCQAYILLSLYGVPARRWEEDRSWLYTGLAIRLVWFTVEYGSPPLTHVFFFFQDRDRFELAPGA